MSLRYDVRPTTSSTTTCSRATALPLGYWTKSTRLPRIPPKLLPSTPCLKLEFPILSEGACRDTVETRRQFETRHQKRQCTSHQRLKLDAFIHIHKSALPLASSRSAATSRCSSMLKEISKL
ncbi:hypothetical protein JMJ77_0005916 [Colletotrichum scovillei]|uniref:Uncharacterized protein n=1 Tax=Colletotrichum scovillei TaxID=1209932 RepID=A0A9P7UJ68_9PEZI|nr:hypothetical protein JMJ77_0005916 [Colletotrichum scovillei]KAG7084255.1 hypothetical protein JMJ78_0009693 [Colletotrichum scovillei]